MSATVEASNIRFGTQIWFGTSLPKKRRLGPKLAGVWAREALKNWVPLLLSATVEASNFKFGTQVNINPFNMTKLGDGCRGHLKCILSLFICHFTFIY